jgi:hypothetical protein
VAHGTVYRWRTEDEVFAAAWDEAKEDTIDVLKASAYERALDGDVTLTIVLLKGGRPEKYKDRCKLSGDPDRPLMGNLAEALKAWERSYA